MVNQNEVAINIPNTWDQIISIGRLLYDKGLIVGGEGNISLRLPDGNLLVTPSRICKGRLTVKDSVMLDPMGGQISGDREPSSELLLHLHIYRQRDDVQAIVHAHPPMATGFAAAGESLSDPILAEMYANFRRVPVTPYANPGSLELAEAIAPFLEDHDALLLRNHGVITFGPDLESAYLRMELVEHFARISLVTRTLGRQSPIPGKYLLLLEEDWRKHRHDPLPTVPKRRSARSLLQELFEELVNRYIKK
ncbi:MAG TPA: class II aldolase/adducin family protein [Thermoanaerobaculia bacterium]|nr:class II aldolase/adducin family protein [Thermoanaerobaculia bacterium]HUM29692.1 class II aldolase/adducin family protein [Thermoanaerobaculia bacterium]HXK66992.1 class II aldolase/adducin family protein [Thermoanaerobaculia bacterium]